MHYQNFGKRYHFSWLSVGVDTKWTWVEARNYCRRFCMDAVSFETRGEYEGIARMMEFGKAFTIVSCWIFIITAGVFSASLLYLTVLKSFSLPAIPI